jgi:hypothetical protein
VEEGEACVRGGIWVCVGLGTILGVAVGGESAGWAIEWVGSDGGRAEGGSGSFSGCHDVGFWVDVAVDVVVVEVVEVCASAVERRLKITVGISSSEILVLVFVVLVVLVELKLEGGPFANTLFHGSVMSDIFNTLFSAIHWSWKIFTNSVLPSAEAFPSRNKSLTILIPIVVTFLQQTVSIISKKLSHATAIAQGAD